MRIKEASIEKFNQVQRRPAFKKLTKELAEVTGYPQYFIADFYDYFVAWFKLQLASGKDVELPNIGRFRRMRVKPRVFYSPLYDKHVLRYTSDTVSYKPSQTVRETMRLARTTAYDKNVYLMWLSQLVDEGKLKPEIYQQALIDLNKEDQVSETSDDDSD